VLRALAATGGVITSARVLLAAVLTVLGVLPVIALTQIGFIVGIGVLLDTLLVRTLVVPALVLLLGDSFWWPARRPGARAAGKEPARYVHEVLWELTGDPTECHSAEPVGHGAVANPSDLRRRGRPALAAPR